ncbi:predicted protein [Nematostella vectensis]|uniref:Tesmin/TSO1-like CXC domain-containing protein n=1 Tax=Nematostella vectensis TaxID=45351 RepID=A7SG30_NEMVE|nr:predicted protein [Nematostella vectensis]|eukprot:XP_001629371.1 predicted protein [Nematostella vectensis]
MKFEDGPNSKWKKDESKKITRSQTTPYDKALCFFCDQPAKYKFSLHAVSTQAAGLSIRSAVEILGDVKLQTKLAISIDTGDAVAIDVKYQNSCYLRNVTNVLRSSQYMARNTELTCAVARETLKNQRFSQDRNQYVHVRTDFMLNVVHTKCNQMNESYVEKTPPKHQAPKQVNEPERLTIKETRDNSVISIEKDFFTDAEMKVIYDAAVLLRKRINNSESLIFTGRFDDLGEMHLPKQLHCYFRWVIHGPMDFASDKKLSEVYKRAVILRQSTISMTALLTARNCDGGFSPRNKPDRNSFPPLTQPCIKLFFEGIISYSSGTTITVANPVLPSPEKYGWKWNDGDKVWDPVMITSPPAPQAIIQLVKCKCAKDKCVTNRCQCKKSGLKCTDLCGCSANGEDCQNKSGNNDEEDNEEESDYDDDDDDDGSDHVSDSESEGKAFNIEFKLLSRYQDLKHELVDLKAQSMRNNLIFYNMNECAEEDPFAVAQKVLVTNFKFKDEEVKAIEIERAHRIGRRDPKKDKPRPLIARFLRFQDRVHPTIGLST